MKNTNAIIALLLFVTSAAHAAPAKQPRQKRTPSQPTRLTDRQKGELSNAIANYKELYLGMEVLRDAEMDIPTDARKKLNELRSTIDRYRKDYSKDTFVMKQVQDFDKYLSKKSPALPPKNQDYYGKLTAPALPAKDQSYYGKLTAPALPERYPQFREFMRTYRNQIILPNNQVNRDWVTRGGQALRLDLGSSSNMTAVKETLWNEMQPTLNEYANSPVNRNNPRYREEIRASFDAAL